MKHTNPAIVEVINFDINEIGRLLQARGYEASILSCDGNYIFTCGDKYYIGTKEFCDTFEKSRKTTDNNFKGFINCVTDIPLFMMIAGIRNDRIDRWQVFISDDLKQTDVCSTVRWCSDRNLHKANALEILQKFAPSKIPEFMKD